MENKITASRLLAGDSDIATLESLLKQSEIRAQDVDESPKEYDEVGQRSQLAAKPSEIGGPTQRIKEQNLEDTVKLRQMPNAQAQIALNRERLSAYSKIFDSLPQEWPETLPQCPEPSKKLQNVLDSVKAQDTNQSESAEANAENAISSDPAGEDSFFNNVIDEPNNAVAFLQPETRDAKESQQKVNQSAADAAATLEVKQPTICKVDASMRISSRQVTKQIDEIQIYCQNRNKHKSTLDADFEPLDQQQAFEREKLKHTVLKEEKTVKRVFADLEATIAAKCRKPTPKRADTQKTVTQKLSTPKQHRTPVKLQMSQSGAKETRTNQKTAVINQTASPKADNQGHRQQRSYSAQQSKTKWYPTPESDIYARSQARKQQFERKLQKLREQYAPREEEFSFQPAISYKGRNYQYVPGTLRFGVSRTLQEYLQQKRQQYTFKPAINRSYTTTRSLSASCTQGRQRYVPEQFTFQPQIKANYRARTPREGDAGVRQYKEFVERQKSAKTIQINCQQEKLTKQQLNQFFERQNEFLARKQQILREFEQAEAQKNTFTPKINHQPTRSTANSPASVAKTPQKQAQYANDFTFKPRIDTYSNKIVQYSGRKPIADTSVLAFREKQIQLRQREREKLLREYKDEYVNSASLAKEVRLNRPALIGDRAW